MRRQGHYSDSGGNAYAAAQMQHMAGQRMEQKSGHYQGRQEPLTSGREHPYGAPKEGSWRWERDESRLPNQMSPHMFDEGQGSDAPRSYYQGQRSDPKMASETQGRDSRSQPREKDVDIGYENSLLSQSFEGLEQRFLDDIMKLSKEQIDAEDAENARHRERISTINVQYQEQLAALRVRHSSRRDDFLRRESLSRHQQYQHAGMDSYPNSGGGMVPSDTHGYGAVPAPSGEPQRAYSADQYNSYRERARFPGGGGGGQGGNRDHEFEQRNPYPGGRVYDTGSRYY